MTNTKIACLGGGSLYFPRVLADLALEEELAGSEVVLYDIDADPWERSDLSMKLPEEAARLEKQMNAFDAKLPKPMWPVHKTQPIEVIGRKTEFVY